MYILGQWGRRQKQLWEEYIYILQYIYSLLYLGANLNPGRFLCTRRAYSGWIVSVFRDGARPERVFRMYVRRYMHPDFENTPSLTARD